MLSQKKAIIITMINVEENIRIVRERMAEAAYKAGRDVKEIKLIAVSKFVDEERIKRAFDCGIDAVGENRVQELTKKLPFFRENGADVNMIGRLQANKVKYIVGKVDSIQSVDREELAKEISRLCVRDAAEQNVFIEVNIGGEAQKGGVETSKLGEFIEMIEAMPGIFVKGLMCIPPAVDEAAAREYFKKMRELFETQKANAMKKGFAKVSLEQLSMGMSGDYTAAIAEGATMVRVGSAIFGPRQ